MIRYQGVGRVLYVMDRSARRSRVGTPAASSPFAVAACRPSVSRIRWAVGGCRVAAVARALSPHAAQAKLEAGEAELLDLRTGAERRRFGAPPGARPVSLLKHLLHPAGPEAIYLCQHAVRSKATLWRGAAEVSGGFVAWRDAGLPVDAV